MTHGFFGSRGMEMQTKRRKNVEVGSEKTFGFRGCVSAGVVLFYTKYISYEMKD